MRGNVLRLQGFKTGTGEIEGECGKENLQSFREYRASIVGEKRAERGEREGDGAEKGTAYNKVRGDNVIDYARRFLDESVPLGNGSYFEATKFALELTPPKRSASIARKSTIKSSGKTAKPPKCGRRTCLKLLKAPRRCRSPKRARTRSDERTNRRAIARDRPPREPDGMDGEHRATARVMI